MENFDWTRFLVRIDVKASKEQLYQAWSTRNGLENWFLRECLIYKPSGEMRDVNEPIQEGDRYLWRWHGHPDESTEEGVFLVSNGIDEIQFQFGQAGRCTVRITEAGGVFLVDLVQDQIPPTEKAKVQFHVGCRTGWIFYLTNLKSFYEGGIDLRNKNPNLQQMLNS